MWGNNMKLNFMGIKDNIFRHRQIEKRDGRIFMRMKNRGFVTVKHIGNGGLPDANK